MSRLDATFAALRAAGRPGLVAYVTAGDPDLARSAEVIRAVDRGGADVIELGVPFSDPLADGPVIQRATERALAAGTTLAAVLDLAAGLRGEVRAPLVLFTYANPVVRLGLEAFAARAAAAGIAGVLVLDLPPEEADDAHAAFTRHGLDTIFLLSPTTTRPGSVAPRPWAAASSTASRGWASPARATTSPIRPPTWRRGFAPRPIGRWPSASGSRGRNTCVRWASGPTPRWSGRRW